jgi:diguanylate cyclase (GGDEF)-like protein
VSHISVSRDGAAELFPVGDGARLMTNLLARIGDYPHLPTPPTVALEVIQKASQPDCEIEDIGRIIALDPGLCAQVLRAVNSALFGLSRPIPSIERAVNFLGLRSLRSLVLCLSLPTMQLQTSTDERLRESWKASLAAAVVARELAVKLRRPDPEDDMVAALLCDLGVFVLQQVFPAEYRPIVAQPREVLAYRQCDLEKAALGLNHADVSAFVLERWRLPGDITEPIRHHHRPAAARDLQVRDRSRLLYLAARAAQLPLCPDLRPVLLREVLELTCGQFRLSEQRFLEFLEPLNRKIEEFAAVLQLDVGSLPSYPTVVANATVELIRLTTESSAEAAHTRAEKQATEEELLRGRRIAHRLRREATRDRPTGAFNRSFFEEALAGEFRRARRRCTVLGLLFLDLDGFKEVNDRHGHAFGDQVLREVAAELRRQVRPGDVVARYGGDEFCVLLAHTSPAEVEVLANRLWRGINGLRVRQGDQVAKVGASVGAAVGLPHRMGRTAGELLATADRAMYAAKRTGKNKVRLFSLLSDADSTFLEALRQLLFSAFLVEREVVTEQQVQAALRSAPPPAVPAGRLARRLGWISPRKLRRVLREVRANRRPFGETALALGYLSRCQVHALLALQREPPEDLANALVDLDALTAEQARREVAAYYEVIGEYARGRLVRDP